MSVIPHVDLPKDVVNKLRSGAISLEPRVYGLPFTGVTGEGILSNKSLLRFTSPIKGITSVIALDSNKQPEITGVSINPPPEGKIGTSITLQLTNNSFVSYHTDSKPLILNKDVTSETTVRELFLTHKGNVGCFKKGDYVVFKDLPPKELTQMIKNVVGFGSDMKDGFETVGIVVDPESSRYVIAQTIVVRHEHCKYTYPSSIFEVVPESIIKGLIEEHGVKKKPDKVTFDIETNPVGMTLGELSMDTVTSSRARGNVYRPHMDFNSLENMSRVEAEYQSAVEYLRRQGMISEEPAPSRPQIDIRASMLAQEAVPPSTVQRVRVHDEILSEDEVYDWLNTPTATSGTEG